MKLCVATIVSPNYLAYARVLSESVRTHMPEADFELLVVGRDEGAAREALAESGMSATWAPELGLADFDLLAYRFDLTEFNTALKPTFLKRLFERGYETVLYLDPDILVYRRLEPVLRALESAEIVLTPHASGPVMDGLRPSDIDFLRNGAYNLGFIGLRRGAQSGALLDWWESRCLSNGYNDFSFGTFVDQKWMDLVPCYFDDVHVLKHRGCNVAYWNLHERKLAQEQDGTTAGGEPLCFFHFSGVDAGRPDLLSRHQNRHVPAPGSVLAELVRDYCGRLLSAGHARWRGLPYPFGVLQDGRAITPLMRRAACVANVDTREPFDPASPLQQKLKAAGVAGRSATAAAATTLNFDPSERRVRIVNAGIRLLARVIGAERVSQLVRYASLLAWRGHLAAVLLDRPLLLDHTDDRQKQAS